MLLLALFCCTAGWTQGVAISEGVNLPHPSAMLDVQSLTKGMLVPRMAESERLAIANPANGLIVYQIGNTPNSRRGYWYYEATEPQWIHLGRGEYVGRVEQPNVHEASYVSGIIPIDVGKSEIIWVVSDITSPPAVLVIPEFSVVSTPPQIDEYCQPDDLSCSNFGRAANLRIYRENFVNTTASPPMMAMAVHPNCNPPHNVNYKYVPYSGTDTYINNSTPLNNFDIDFCNESGTLGLYMISGTANSQKSFSFWVDLNHDGDFDDPGELIDTRVNLTANITSTLYVFGLNPGWYPPIVVPQATINDGMTKMRITIRENGPPQLNPCFPGDGNHKTYDFDMNVTCGGAGPPFFPNDLNWCNVDNVTNSSARVSCFDKNGTPTDMNFHYKLVPLD